MTILGPEALRRGLAGALPRKKTIVSYRMMKKTSKQLYEKRPIESWFKVWYIRQLGLYTVLN